MPDWYTSRSCHDACEQLFTYVSRKAAAQWVIEGDIKACFDEIAYEWLLRHIPMDKRILDLFDNPLFQPIFEINDTAD
jgi:RNA-directed DNA polymerase